MSMSGMDGARALVVDDDETIRAVVRRLVEIAGGSVAEAATGEDALRALYAERPDIVVLDIDLRGGASAGARRPSLRTATRRWRSSSPTPRRPSTDVRSS